jgi:hypothetical protein
MNSMSFNKIILFRIGLLSGILSFIIFSANAENKIPNQLNSALITKIDESIPIHLTKAYEKGKLLPATTELASGILDISNLVKKAKLNSDCLSIVKSLSDTTSPTSITTQTFENSFPEALWSVYSNLGSIDAYWGVVDSFAYEGEQSAWCAGGGSKSIEPSSGSYLNKMDGWMVYGPFNLSDATSGNISFYLNSNTESGYDFFKYMVSTDGINFKGWQVSGSTSGWVKKSIDFTDIPVLGNICGFSNVYVAFNFLSDGTTCNYSGSFVDSIAIQKVAGPKPNLELSSSSLSATVALNQTLSQFITIANSGNDSLNWQLTDSYPVLGSWNLFFDWSCDGAPSTIGMIFLTNGTFNTPNSNGTWSMNGNQVEWNYSFGTKYYGTINGDTMTGRIEYENTDLGCWTAIRNGTAQQSWISLSPTSGSLPAGNSQRVKILFSSSEHTIGSYNSSIFLSSNDPVYSSVRIPVKMTVSSCTIPATPVIDEIDNPTCFVETGDVVLNNLPGSGLWRLNEMTLDTIITGTGTSTTVSSLSPGIYTFTVTNSTGCTSNPSDEVIIDLQPEIPAAPGIGSITQPGCDSETGGVWLTGLSPNGSWIMSNNPYLPIIFITGTDTIIDGIFPGTWIFTATGSSGCTSLASDSVVINEQLATPTTPEIVSITQPSCQIATGSVELKGLPSVGTWKITDISDSIAISGSGPDTVITGFNPGSYYLKVANEAGCFSDVTDKVVINEQPLPPSPLIGTIVQSTCLSSANSLTLYGFPSDGTWMLTGISGDSIISGSGDSITLTALPEGTYTFKITDEKGCTSLSSDSAVINKQPQLSPPAIGSIIQPSCLSAIDSLILFNLPVTGTWTLTRIPGEISVTSTGESIALTNIPEGEYSFTIANEEGCVSKMSDKVVINAQPSTPSAPNIYNIIQPTATDSTGSVLLNQLPVTGSWILTRTPDSVSTIGSGESTTLSLISAGTYHFTVTNESGCTSDTSKEVIVKEYVSSNILGKNSSLLLYPNPVSNELVIELEANNKSIPYEIINGKGQVVSRSSLVNKAIVQTISYPPGVYMIRININKAPVCQTFIKQNN